jgi:hypothetical protein
MKWPAPAAGWGSQFFSQASVGGRDPHRFLVLALIFVAPTVLSGFRLNLLGRFLAPQHCSFGDRPHLGGYTGMLSLGHGVFFALGGYALGMHLKLQLPEGQIPEFFSASMGGNGIALVLVPLLFFSVSRLFCCCLDPGFGGSSPGIFGGEKSHSRGLFLHFNSGHHDYFL